MSASWLAALEAAGAKLTDAGHRELGRNPRRLKTICAWCGDVIRDGALTHDGKCSHGICAKCEGAWRRGAKL